MITPETSKERTRSPAVNSFISDLSCKDTDLKMGPETLLFAAGPRGLKASGQAPGRTPDVLLSQAKGQVDAGRRFDLREGGLLVISVGGLQRSRSQHQRATTGPEKQIAIGMRTKRV